MQSPPKSVEKRTLYVNTMQDTNISITGGPLHSTYYSIGDSLCRIINLNHYSNSMRCKTTTAQSTIASLEQIRNGKADFALIQAGLAEYGSKGSDNNPKVTANPNLRFVLSLRNEDLMLVVKNDSSIKDPNNLNQFIISSGADDISINASPILNSLIKAKNMKPSDFKMISYVQPQDQPNALCDKAIDILTIIGSNPDETLTQTSKNCEIRALEIDSNTIDLMLQQNNLLLKTTVYAGLYPGILNDINTVATKTIIVTNSTASEEVVYNFVKTIIENIDIVKRIHPALVYLTPSDMLQGQSIDIHEGALKYFREKGYTQK